MWAPQRSRRVEWLPVHDLERTFRLDSNQRGEDFPSARGTKNLCLRLQIPVALDSTQRGDGFSERARNQKSLPRRGRKPEGLKGAPQRSRRVEWLPVHDLERTFRLDSNQRGEDFPSARGTKNLCLAEGVSPRGYWFESEEQIKQEPPRRSLEGSCFMRSPDWTRTSNPSINSRMLCQLSYGGIFCFRCAVSLATSNNYTGGLGAPQAEI